MKITTNKVARLIVIGLIVCVFICGLAGCAIKNYSTSQNQLAGKYYFVISGPVPDNVPIDIVKEVYLQFTDKGICEMYNPITDTIMQTGTYTLNGHTLSIVSDDPFYGSGTVIVSSDYSTLTFADENDKTNTFQYRRR